MLLEHLSDASGVYTLISAAHSQLAEYPMRIVKLHGPRFFISDSEKPDYYQVSASH